MCRVKTQEYVKQTIDDGKKLTDAESEFVSKILEESIDHSNATIRSLIAQLRLVR